jgi:hypothetical protein
MTTPASDDKLQTPTEDVRHGSGLSAMINEEDNARHRHQPKNTIQNLRNWPETLFFTPQALQYIRLGQGSYRRGWKKSYQTLDY